MSYNAPPDLLDRDLVLLFFWNFSVFECALKREGFLRSSDQNGIAEADWRGFGKSIRGRFGDVSAHGFHESVRTLKYLSPRRQVVRDGCLRWASVKQHNQESEEEFVLRLVKTVRNNLFHGGKYPDGPIEEVARDKAILKAALGVLQGCYELHPGVARWVQEAAA